jgi:hypothetical protein
MPREHAQARRAATAKKRLAPLRRSADGKPGLGTAPATAERDETIGLISVIYHALQGAEACAGYAEDARRAKNARLVAFFGECQVEHNERALRARELLAQTLRASEAAVLEDDDDELEEDSIAAPSG